MEGRVKIIETCSFCGKNIDYVNSLVKSPSDSGIFICDSCARIVFSFTDKPRDEEKRKKVKKLAEAAVGTGTVKKGPGTTPSEIHREMDRFIIGQEKAKKTLSVAVYNHGKRLKDKSGLIKKSNILLIGPSGCGKTLLAKTLARLLDLPFVIADATRMTEAGYVGDNVENSLQRLLEAAGGDVELAQKGIVYIDEIDKIAYKESAGRDIGGKSVQEALLNAGWADGKGFYTHPYRAGGCNNKRVRTDDEKGRGEAGF